MNTHAELTKTKTLTVNVARFETQLTTWKIRGTAPLLQNGFSEEALDHLGARAQGHATVASSKLDAKLIAEGHLTKTHDGKHAHPAIAFKKAMVGAIRIAGKAAGIKSSKTEARGLFQVLGEDGGDLAIIRSDPYTIRAAVAAGTHGKPAIATFRPEFRNWSTVLQIRFNPKTITPEQVGLLLNTAGFCIGVGSWRPECDGIFGTFEVASE